MRKKLGRLMAFLLVLTLAMAMVAPQVVYAEPGFPQVADVNGGNRNTNGTSHTVNLPANITAGNLLLVFFAADADPTITFPANWTQLFQEEQDNNVKFGAWYRIADGTEGATITVNTDESQRSAHTSYRITGYCGTPEAATATGDSDHPNPPNLAPSWGAADTLWFAACGYDDGREDVEQYPGDYSNGRNDRSDDDEGCGVGSARRELNAASEDPGQFTISDDQDWVAATVAIAPAGGITLAPDTATNKVDSTHTVYATISCDTGGTNVTFNVTAGPNAGDTGIESTNSSGVANWTYTGDGGSGTDTIIASYEGVVVHSQLITTTGDGNFTVPAGVNNITAEAWGAGGAGGGRSGSDGCGGGGGGGAYASKNFTGLTPGANISYYVAPTTAGGTGNGANGAATWFSSNDSNGVVAAGGSGGTSSSTGGTGGAGGSTGSSYGDTKYSGGNGADGHENSGDDYGGGGGGGAGSSGNGDNASVTNGGDPTSEYGGAGGDGRTDAQGSGPGSPGSDYGGGGGGARRHTGTQYGGDGAQGLIRITWETLRIYSNEVTKTWVDCSNVKVQLAMILDGSTSVGSPNFTAVKQVLETAVTNSSCVPHDGSVELTVVQFSTNATVEVGPVVITAANANKVASQIANITQLTGSTCICCGICLAADTLAASPCFNASDRQVLNLVTDGDPNRCCNCSFNSQGPEDPSADSGDFNNSDNAYHDNSSYATATNGEVEQYYGYNFTIPGGDTVHGIVVRLDAERERFRSGSIAVELSWDGGGNWTSTGYGTGSLDSDPDTYDLGGACDDWGHNWTASEVNNSTAFRVRLTVTATGWVRLYWVPVTVYYGDGTGCGYEGFSCSDAEARCSALCAREYAINLLQMTDTQDEFDVECINTTDANPDWLTSNILFPATNWSSPPQDWPPPGPGWLRLVTNSTELAEAICQKVAQVVGYNLTVTSNGCCPIDVSYGYHTVVPANNSTNFTNIPFCTNVTLTADDSDPCCVFGNWTGNVTGAPNSTNPVIIHIDGDKEVTGNCETLAYNLTVTSNGCCPINVSYDAVSQNISAGTNQTFTDIPCCTNVTLTANVTDPCCVFGNWTGNVTGAPNITNPVIIHIDGDKEVTGNCETLAYNLTVTSDGCCLINVSYGAVSQNISAGTNQTFTDIPCCTNVTLTANVTDPCCVFGNWTGNVTGAPNSTNPVIIHIDGDKEVTGNCETLAYNLTVTSNGCCPINVSYDGMSENISAGANQSFTIDCCTNVTLTADDSGPCCGFGNWTGNVTGAPNITNPVIIHIDGDKEVTGNCETLGAYNLKVTSNGCCPIEVAYPCFSDNVSAGTNRTFTNIPCCTNVTLTANVTDPCCVFGNWTGNVTGAPNSTNPIIIHIDGDKEVTGNCETLAYNLTVTSNGCCPIDISYDTFLDTVPANDSRTFTNIPCCTNVTLTADDSDACCEFGNWTGNVPGAPNSTNPVMIHIDGDKSVTGHCSTISPDCNIAAPDPVCEYSTNNSASTTAVGDSYSWSLSAGTITDGQNTQSILWTAPAHASSPVVTISLNVTKDGCSASCSKNVTIDEAPVAAFSATPTSGSAPLTVKFTDLSTGTLSSWNWMFTGGTPSSATGPGPHSVIYSSPGKYTVTLVVSNACCGSNSTTDINLITVSGPPPVGGEAYPINKLPVLAPWIVLAAAIMVGAGLAVPRRPRGA